MFPEDSVEEICSRVALFQSRDVLERSYKGCHGGELSAGKADEMIRICERSQDFDIALLRLHLPAQQRDEIDGQLACLLLQR